jgi:phosphate transport system substrate-binding protein
MPTTSMRWKTFSKKKTGTGFGGEAEVGVKVSDLLKRNPKE